MAGANGLSRGTKRPREEAGSEVPGRPTSRRKLNDESKDEAQVFSSKLRYGVKEVNKAAKAAKVFETQRLIKKLKQARKENEGGETEDVSTLEGQLSALKTIDPHDISTYALSLKISKDPLLKANDVCTTAAASELPSPVSPPPPTSDDGKAWNRLLSSKKLSSALASILSNLRRVLGTEEMSASKPKKSTTSDGKGGQQATSKRKRKAQSGVNDDGALHDVGSDDMLSEASGSNVEEEDEAVEPAADTDVDIGDADAAGWESGSVHSAGSANVEDSDGEDADDDDDVSDASGVWKRGESTFLPALNHGFVVGSDGSDYGDADVAPERKNRRGQRARKAIWEKKYGKNANHVKKQREVTATVQARGKMARTIADRGGKFAASRGGAPARGRPDFSSRGRPGGRGGVFGSRGGATGQRGGHRTTGTTGTADRAAPETAPSVETQVAERPLHPSWVAKQKEKAAAQFVRPQGKKIVFG